MTLIHALPLMEVCSVSQAPTEGAYLKDQHGPSAHYKCQDLAERSLPTWRWCQTQIPVSRKWRCLDLKISRWLRSQKWAARSSIQACAPGASGTLAPLFHAALSAGAQSHDVQVHVPEPVMAVRAADELRVKDEITREHLSP